MVPLINLSQTLFIVCLVSIGTFVIYIIDPRRIQIESEIIKNRIEIDISEKRSHTDENGKQKYDNYEFLITFLEIENKINQILKSIKNPIYKQESNKNSTVDKIKILLMESKIDKNLYRELQKLITLRNSIFHGKNTNVNKNTLTISKEILEKLRELL